jgi:hypothetical protein
MRTISTTRRLGLVDMYWPVRYGVKSYILKAASNFDAVFGTFANVPATGYKSKSVVNNRFDMSQYRDKTRITFSPIDFHIDDLKPIWMRIAPINFNGVVGADESIHLILPYSTEPKRAVILNGTVPPAASISGSLELNLPQQCFNPVIQNDGGVDLYIAFEATGSEFRISPLSTSHTMFISTHTTFSQVFLRGLNASTKISADFTLRNEAIC